MQNRLSTKHSKQLKMKFTKEEYKTRMKAAKNQSEVDKLHALDWWHHNLLEEERKDLIRQYKSASTEQEILSIWKSETLWP